MMNFGLLLGSQRNFILEHQFQIQIQRRGIFRFDNQPQFEVIFR